MRSPAVTMLLLAAAFSHSSAFSQSTALVGPAFEVASVRPALYNERSRTSIRGGPGTDTPDAIYATSLNLSGLIQRAYEVKMYQFIYPRGWMTPVTTSRHGYHPAHPNTNRT